MREIKFRAWDKANKAMRNVCELSIDHGELHGLMDGKFEYDGRYYFPEEAEIMQYTGLKDKNGKEIYEGDIVEISGDPYCQFIKDGDKILVEWAEYGWGLFIEEHSDFDGITENNCTVIGNKYENPELLT